MCSTLLRGCTSHKVPCYDVASSYWSDILIMILQEKMIVNLKYKGESEDLNLSRLKRRLAWEVKAIELWEFVFNVFGVQKENSDVSKLNKVSGVEQVGKIGC